MNPSEGECDHYVFHVPRGSKIFAVAVCAIRISDNFTGLTNIANVAYSEEHAIEVAKPEAYRLLPLSEYRDHIFSAVEIKPNRP